jgi:hypothetical protein
MIVTLQTFMRKAAGTADSRMQQDDVVRIQSLMACFERMRDASPPSLLVSAADGGTGAARHAASSANFHVHGGSISDAAIATPDLDRLCSSFHGLFSNSSRLAHTLDDMFPYYARRIQEILVTYPHVSTNGSCYRHLVPTRDLQLALRDAGFEARNALHERKIDLSALMGSGDGGGADAALVAWKEVLSFLGPLSTDSGGAMAVWLTKDAFLLAAGDASPLSMLFGDHVLGCIGFAQQLHLLATRRAIQFEWACFAREPADPDEVERLADAIVRLVFVDPANDHFCLLRDRNAALVPSGYLGALSLVRMSSTDPMAQDPAGGVLACMRVHDRKFHGMLRTCCSCLIPALGMGLGPSRLLLVADAEEQSAVEFPQLLDALSRSKVVEAIAVLFPRGRPNGGLNRAWIDALANAIPHLDRLEEIHIE